MITIIFLPAELFDNRVLVKIIRKCYVNIANEHFVH